MDWVSYTDLGNATGYLCMVAGVSAFIWLATRPGRDR